MIFLVRRKLKTELTILKWGSTKLNIDRILTDKEQEDHLKNLCKQKKIVTFHYPEEPKIEKFDWIESFVMKDPDGRADVNYWIVIDKLEYTGNCPENKKTWLRMTYWRYKTAPIVKISTGKNQGKITNRRWIIAGQTSFSDPMQTFEEFFVQAIKNKEWIRPLFKKIIERCSEELK